MVTSRGGGSSGIRSTSGTWRRFSLTSWLRAADLARRPGFAKENAFGFLSVYGQSHSRSFPACDSSLVLKLMIEIDLNFGIEAHIPPVFFFFSFFGL